MKNLLVWCGYLTFILLCFGTAQAAPVNLRVCVLETGFGNYTMTSGDGSWQKILKASVSDLDIKLSFTYAPRERCLLWAKKGDIDAVYAAITADKKTYLKFPEKNGKEDPDRMVEVVHYKIYKKRNSNLEWDGKNFTNLGENTIGVQRGLQIEQSLRDNKVKVDGDLVATVEQNLTKLNLGRIVAAAVEERQGDEFLKNSGMNDIVKLEKSYSRSVVYFAVTNRFFHNHDELVEKIWRNIKSRRGKYLNTTPAYYHPDENLILANL